jgi:hypothetical protein
MLHLKHKVPLNTCAVWLQPPGKSSSHSGSSTILTCLDKTMSNKGFQLARLTLSMRPPKKIGGCDEFTCISFANSYSPLQKKN